ncbi:MAG: hypothetical protein AAB901_00940, partial [Patescibacteria group bacterium]
IAATPWMEFLNLSPEFLKAKKVWLKDGDPVVARILPPVLDVEGNRFFQSRVQFMHNGGTFHLSEIADSGAQDSKNGRITIVPPLGRTLLFIKSKERKLGIMKDIYEAPQAPPIQTPIALPFRKLIQRPTPAVAAEQRKAIEAERKALEDEMAARALPAPEPETPPEPANVVDFQEGAQALRG